MVERIDDEQQRLVAIDVERLVDDLRDLERTALDLRGLDGVRDLAERREQPTAVDLQRPRGIGRRGAHEAELDAEPEEARHPAAAAGAAAPLLPLIGGDRD